MATASYTRMLFRLLFLIHLFFIPMFVYEYVNGQTMDESEKQSFQSLTLYEKSTLEKTYLEYSEKIWDLDRELISLNSHREWVHLRIERLRFKNKPVPSDMNQALSTLDDKISAIESEKATLHNLMDNNLKRLSELEREVKAFSRKTGDDINWWQIHPKIAIKMTPVMKGGDESIAMVEEMLAKNAKWPDIKKWVELTGENNGIYLRNTLPILFGSGKAVVSKDYHPFLKNLALVLKPLNVSINVEGFTDSTPLKGNKTFRSNYELAATRAANVANVLMEAGMPNDRIRIISHGGKKMPKTEKKTVSRRVDISVNFSEKQPVPIKTHQM